MLIDYYYIKNKYISNFKNIHIYFINHNTCRIMINNYENINNFTIEIYNIDNLISEKFNLIDDFINKKYIDIQSKLLKFDYYTDIIPKYIASRDYYLIKNKYTIINEKYDINIVIYYEDNHNCKIIVRRMDNKFEEEWNTEIQIIINDIEKNKKEIIFLDISNEKNIYNLKTELIELKKLIPNNQNIPKKIFQTGETNKIKNRLHYNSIISFIDLNPDYEYYYYDNIDGREFICKNFEINVNNAYDILIPGAYKADLLRYCLLYIYGGCYFDCKQILRKSLYNIIKKDDNLLLCNDVIEDGILNAVIMSISKLDFLIDAIVNCAKNVFEKNMSCPLGITGPRFLFNIYQKYSKNYNPFILKNCRPDYNQEDYHTDYINNNIKLKENNNIILSRFYKGYYDNYLNTNHYGKLFHNNQVYYKNVVNINNYLKILVYPNNDDIFHFNHINNKIIIKNISKISWGYDLIITIINLNTFVEKIINIGSSSSQYRDISY